MSDTDGENDADAGSSQGPPSSGRKVACSQCRQRKVKCDREHPCLACLTTGRDCTAPPAPGPRRPRRRNNHVLRAKLESLESLLQQCIESQHTDIEKQPPESAGPDDLSPTASQPTESDDKAKQPKGYLVQTRSGGVEFRSGKISSLVFHDLQTIKAVLQVEAEQGAWLPFFPSQTPSQLRSGTLTVRECIPTPNEVILLWGIFLDRVDPVTKIIHVPTFSARIVDAAANFGKMALQMQALIFSLLLAASGSLSRQEHHNLLGRTKSDTMSMLSRGFKATMTQLNYVRKYNSEVLRALIFYSLARQGAQRRSCDPWVLHGLIVNIAYSLGLHIDGEGTGLSPFEFEMRRRLWWQVVELEVKHTVAAGVGTFLMRKLSNTKLPSNLDDRVLDPDMVTLPQSRNGPTDMSFCLTAYERCFWIAGKLQQNEINLIDELIFSDPSREVDETATKKRSDARNWVLDFMATSTRDLGPEARQRCPDMSNPLHAMITQTMASLESILLALIMPMQETPEWGTEVHGPADNLFRISVVALEFAQREQQNFGHRFLWYANISFTLNGLFYVVAQLQERVSGSLADRAWACIEKAYGYHEELWDLDDKETMTLGNLAIVAWDARQAHFVSRRIPLPEPRFVTTLRETVMMMKVQAMSLLAEV
ncbi:hypothetical protein BN1723_003842 [Verticillium longisporum]|uniref:Zn(2)-C6 fungal-type domain-containing protein n=1 Tax=Verticillium longisporum TaxID=100787 RepID=A0A0G4MH97_VERLO|nr:Pyriculol/pyriculariol biosynthesis cluster transcription factor like protein [Verticillium longisporum]CRK32173.1 hypothetical protein BN1723_003842 [Verticillium longisporum]CRK33646.1 hypothetical protein BN1708_016262 [Verticillium longisporum]